ncbi:MAG TPA: DNA polymerase III subunit delta' [Candidatus Methylomirabilis sp.]|nr:DNA polymerase III subunit delta' [Candidatus Methylomirabilis sp.]
MAGDDTSGSIASPNAERYPWHEALWETLSRQFERLPHALLLHGRPGLGKHAFAMQLTQTLLCAHPHTNGACGRCHDCRLFVAGTHPDVSVIGLAEDAKIITIDQIRALGDFLSLRPHTAARKVVIISPAEAMNLNAANALLKLLEEPPLGSILVLVSSHPARLPATVRSRCSRVFFKVPARNEGLSWLRSHAAGGAGPEALLELAGGSPLRAMAMAEAGFVENREQLLRDLNALQSGSEDPVACAARWKSLGAGICLGWLYSFITDLIKLRIAGSVNDVINLEAKSFVADYKNKYGIMELYNLVDVIGQYYRQLGGSLDELLILEDILIRWARISRLQ